MMSASLDEARARSLAEKCGATDYLPKPFEPQQVLELVSRMLLRGSLELAGAAHAP